MRRAYYCDVYYGGPGVVTADNRIADMLSNESLVGSTNVMIPHANDISYEVQDTCV